MIKIKGNLERLTFQNPENHYTIARLRVEKINDPITVVGYLAGVSEGESLEVSGSWVSHPKWGEQFKAEMYRVILPASVSGIRKYLGSGMIKGIGQSMADRIVDHFKETTLDVIENEPEKLKQIHGIGEAKRKVIEAAWNRHHAVRKVMQFLSENGVGVQHAAQVLKLYGSEALSVLTDNPYQLAKDLPGPGFRIADRIAFNSGLDKEHQDRLCACLIFCLLSAEQEGHVFVLKPHLLQQASRQAGVDMDLFDPALDVLADDGDIRIEEKEEQVRIYLAQLYRAETATASRIKAMLTMPVRPAGLDRETILELVLSKVAVKLSDEQLEVIIKAVDERIMVITGGPGTGKTTLVRAICAVFDRLKKKVVLSAPTGRAARRLSQVTGKKASTLHKLLGFDHENQAFERNVSNPLDLDVLVVDEASMVDIHLMARLILATPVTARLVMVGDTFQLPSVGPGNVLSDIITSGCLKVFSLTQIFRQAEESPIIRYAHRIRNGEQPEFLKAKSGELSEFYFIETGQPSKVVETITELCSQRIPKAFPHISEVQVLTPMHKGEAGTINLNQQLQSVLNPGKGGMAARGMTFRPKDKVMHLKNNYDKEVFNGDIGVVHAIEKSENRIWVAYDDRLVEYDILELDELTLAYTISVHKSQGSEYEAVIIALTTAHYPLLQRNLLYTAMTRGKNLVIIVGSTKALQTALGNNKTELRLSGLKERLETD